MRTASSWPPSSRAGAPPCYKGSDYLTTPIQSFPLLLLCCYSVEGDEINKIVSAVAAALGLAYSSLFGGPIDDSAWEIKIKRDTFFSFSSRRDTLIFENGKLTSAGGIARGFSSSAYDTSGDGTAATIWKAEMEDDEMGIMNWRGVIEGDRIKGKAVWLTKEGDVKRFTFKGSRKELR